MQRRRWITGLCVTAGLAVATTAIMAQQTREERAQRKQQIQQKQDQQGQVRGERDKSIAIEGTVAEEFKPIRASKLIGMEVRNEQDKDLGEINDLVLDQFGEVRYVALSHGGVLGIGDKLTAVPWAAFALKAEQDDPDDHFLMLDVTEERLSQAPGFKEDNWPAATAVTFWIEVDKHYGMEAGKRRGVARPDLDDDNDREVKQNRDRTRPQQPKLNRDNNDNN